MGLQETTISIFRLIEPGKNKMIFKVGFVYANGKTSEVRMLEVSTQSAKSISMSVVNELKSLFPDLKTSVSVHGIAFNNFSIIWDDYDGDVVTIANCKELSIVIKSIHHMQKMEKEVQKINVIKKYKTPQQMVPHKFVH